MLRCDGRNGDAGPRVTSGDPVIEERVATELLGCFTDEAAN
jgi:hypothetical protein